MIKLTSFANAVRQLAEAIPEQAAEPKRFLLRSGLIQTFEYNYELAIVMLTRYLSSIAPDPGKLNLNIFEELIRAGDREGLLLSPIADWKRFRQARNNTSHTYDEAKAIDVLNVIPAFEKEVQYLLVRLQERLGA